MGNYNKFPSVKIDEECFRGYESIIKQIKNKINKKDYKLMFDTYPGVNDDEIIKEIKKLKPDTFINMKNIFKDEKVLTNQLKYHLTDDRVFGKMYFGDIIDFIDEIKLNQIINQLKSAKGLVIIYGFGSRILCKPDLLIYLDLARWQIQLRYRKGLGNYNCNNNDEDILKKYKRAFFIEWRVADKHKQRLFDEIDYLLDTNINNDPKMISGNTFRRSLEAITKQPFRTVPYFDQGVWGGQWMKEVCDLDRNSPNFAWSFDGVPEENSILLNVGGIDVEIPAMDLVLYKPKELLGEKVFARFGAEFPIRFDFLDTMGGQNLSLQVHPLTEYAKKEFGISYTQDESYYILDAKQDAHVYLGLKENISPSQMFNDLEMAQKGDIVFDVDKYINKFPAKKHDHFLIPAGTCHCSGKDVMVLEISATPYIFTFKLWDWQRVGLDGLPRPVHIEHGKQVIDWSRTTKWVESNLVNSVYEVNKSNEVIEEHTGLHELEFIETRRFRIKSSSLHNTNGTVNMLNLVDGEEAIVESPTGAFKPFIVHYAETFIIPASIEEYTIKPFGSSLNKEIIIIKAYVRT